jgi:hypothetical protein
MTALMYLIDHPPNPSIADFQFRSRSRLSAALVSRHSVQVFAAGSLGLAFEAPRG